MFKKVMAFTAMAAFLVTMAGYPIHCVYGAPESINVSAVSAVLIDKETGRILYQKNARDQRSMASTTKIMTAILALEKGNPDDIVQVSKNAAHVEGSSMYLAQGERIRLEDLVYGLMLSSGNDAAVAIAEHIGGSVEEFAKMMTQKAHDIGADHTSFKNPHGLDQEGHYTTAYDLALITRYAYNNPKFAEIASTKKKEIPWPGHETNRIIYNHNQMLSIYPGCNGVKTGYTIKTGRCLVSSAVRDNWQLIAVTLNGHEDWDDHKKMLDYGFNQYQNKAVVQKGEYLKTLPVMGGIKDKVPLVAESDFKFPIRAGEESKINVSYTVPDQTDAPVSYHERYGEITVCFDGVEYGSVSLVSDDVIGKKIEKNIKTSCYKILRNWMITFFR